MSQLHERATVCVSTVTNDQHRFVAVKLRRRNLNLHAGVEDRLGGELIYVANASMAIRLAGWLNDEAEGRPLPERGPQHTPIRFQLAHDALPDPNTSVLYVHGNGIRIVAYAPSDETARHLQRLLLHVDYPVDEFDFLTPPKAHDFGDRVETLPAQTLQLPKRESRYWKRTLGVALWMWIPLLILLALVGYAISWLFVLLIVAGWTTLVLLMPMFTRQ
jgi:hypothetical protein